MSEKKIKVRVKNLTKRYQMAPKPSDKLKALFWKQDFPDFWALRGIDFEAYEGEAIAIIGTNGSGKSTLMKIITGILPPTTGTVEVNGEVSLLAINAGLKGGMTGRENIRLKAMLLGLSDEEIEEKMDEIIAFSELGGFIDQRVKTYSSGMKSKLGFAISINTNPDILIVDEALSVGDATFAKKSFAEMKRFKEEGKTIFFVSHSMSQIKQMADKVMWLDHGRLRRFGTREKVLDEYDAFLKRIKKMSGAQRRRRLDKIRTTQRDYSLDDLYNHEIKRAANIKKREDADALITRTQREKIFQETHAEFTVKKTKFVGKIFIGLIALLTVVTADKTILNLSSRSIINHPTKLITNWHPDRIKALDERHGRVSSSKKETPKIAKVTDKNGHETTVKVVGANDYTVKDGDTLDAIAREFRTTPAAIRVANNLSDNFIAEGQVIKIPMEGTD